jgi:hypothetical protein
MMAFSFPAKRALNFIFGSKTRRFINPLRIEVFIDFTLFFCIMTWAI